MPAIFPSTALRSNQTAVKRAAKDAPVIITDNNDQYYYFSSEKAFEQQLSRESELAAYAARMAHGIRRAKEEISRGECVIGAGAAIAAAQRMRQHD